MLQNDTPIENRLESAQSAADLKSSTQLITQETMPVPRLMTQDTAASILGVSPKWLERDRWIEKRIPFVKIGRGVRYRAIDIVAYIEANIQGAV